MELCIVTGPGWNYVPSWSSYDAWTNEHKRRRSSSSQIF